MKDPLYNVPEDNSCKGIFGLLFGHDFEDMYDEKNEYQLNTQPWNSVHNLTVLNGHFQTPLLKEEETYVKSVCKRCGKEIKRG